MKSEPSSASTLAPSPPTKPASLLVSDLLTRSEIDELRLKKKQILDYAQKALREKFEKMGLLG